MQILESIRRKRRRRSSWERNPFRHLSRR